MDQAPDQRAVPGSDYVFRLIFRLSVAAIYFAGTILSVGAPIVICWQVFVWLRTGVWHPLLISDGLAYARIASLHVAWVGAQEILDWIFSRALSVGMLIVGVPCWLGGLFVMKKGSVI